MDRPSRPVEGAKTAIRRSKPSTPVRWLAEHGYLTGRALDFGCGRGLDAVTFGMDAYDPYWHPITPAGPYNTIVCVYVLNVVSEETQATILTELGELLTEDGTAYVAVRRDLPPRGRAGRGIWQRYVILDAPLVREVSGYAIYEISRSIALQMAAPSKS